MTNQIDYKGFKIIIKPDDFINDSPNDWGNDDCFLVYDHRDFCVERKYFDPADIYEAMRDKKALFDGYFYFPVYAYIHSGVSLSLVRYFNVPQGHNEFDVSFRGFALVKKEKGCYTREKAYESARSLLTTWNDYLSGNVWNFVVKDADDNIIDSCCGFYGNPEESGCIDEAKSVIDYEVKKRLSKRLNSVKTWIKNRVPIEVRQGLIAELA